LLQKNRRNGICRIKPPLSVNVRIPAAGMEIARPARSTTAKPVQGQIAEKMTAATKKIKLA